MLFYMYVVLHAYNIQSIHFRGVKLSSPEVYHFYESNFTHFKMAHACDKGDWKGSGDLVRRRESFHRVRVFLDDG